VSKLMRSFKSTQSESMRQYYLKFFSDKPCRRARASASAPSRGR